MVHTEAQKEQDYLNQVYQELWLSKAENEKRIETATQQGHEMLSAAGKEIRLNFDSYLDNLDTFSMIETKNREIDQLNTKNIQAQREIDKIKRLLKAPYFGKVSVQFIEEDEKASFYFGINGFKNEQGENRIYDWRSPISELFYNNEIGLSSYVANKQEIFVDIINRRQFILQQNQLINYFDTTVSIQDDVLLEALTTDDSSYMQDITGTIQIEQNKIIRDTQAKAILVNGIAGSGKTSTVMQRIAYLLYLFREDISADNVLLLSPNTSFIEYISRVLPSLGEKNPINLTMLAFVQELNPESALESEQSYFERISRLNISEQERVLRSRKFIDFLMEQSKTMVLDILYVKDIIVNKQKIFSKETLIELYLKTPEKASVKERIQAVKAQLLSLWQQQLLKSAESQRVQDELLNLSEQQQLKYFHKILGSEDEAYLKSYALKRLKHRYKKVTQIIKNCQWIDSNHLLKGLYHSYTNKELQSNQTQTLDELVALTIIKCLFIEMEQKNPIKFVLIDEVQDYTPAQLLLILLLFPTAEFTLVGDENQAIFNSVSQFSEISDLFSAQKISVVQYDILNSYRSSGEITRLFAPLTTQKIEVVAVRPSGEPPQFFMYQEESEYLEKIQEISRQLPGQRLTLLTKSEQQKKEFEAKINKEQVHIYTIGEAKGLEFDYVLFHDVSKKNFKTDADRRLLYTGISRAMKSIWLSYDGELTEFLSSQSNLNEY